MPAKVDPTNNTELSIGAIAQSLWVMRCKITRKFRKEFRKTALLRAEEDHSTSSKTILFEHCRKKPSAKRGLPRKTPSTVEPIHATPCLGSEPVDIEKEFYLEGSKAILEDRPTHELAIRITSVIKDLDFGQEAHEGKGYFDLGSAEKLHISGIFLMFLYYTLYCSEVQLRSSQPNLIHVMSDLIHAASTLESVQEFPSRMFPATLVKVLRLIHKLTVVTCGSLNMFRDFLDKSSIGRFPQLNDFSGFIVHLKNVDDQMFREVVDERQPAFMTLPLTWKAFDNWDFYNLFYQEGFQKVRCRIGSGPPTVLTLGDFLFCLLNKKGPHRPQLDAETFFGVHSLYDQCLPRPFPELGNFWGSVAESIHILVPGQMFSFDLPYTHTLVVQIFGVCSFQIGLDLGGMGFLTMNPRDCFYFPDDGTYEIFSETECCFKVYTWPYKSRFKPSLVPFWVEESDRRADILAKRREKSKSRSSSLKRDLEVPSLPPNKKKRPSITKSEPPFLLPIKENKEPYYKNNIPNKKKKPRHRRQKSGIYETSLKRKAKFPVTSKVLRSLYRNHKGCSGTLKSYSLWICKREMALCKREKFIRHIEKKAEILLKKANNTLVH